MRTERENYITGFEHNKKHSGSGQKINFTTRSERIPNLEHENLKGIINTENYGEANRDNSPHGNFTPVKNNPLYDEISQSDFNLQNQLQENPFASIEPLQTRDVMEQFKMRSANLRSQREKELLNL